MEFKTTSKSYYYPYDEGMCTPTYFPNVLTWSNVWYGCKKEVVTKEYDSNGKLVKEVITREY